ncbi:hypothetical protein ACERZ8_03555 [Tateyamaria armeniaca]|uniref:Uncharacterized protein n=1 Tax=Tateyamaria armeniaca TaxID=2518930 RepID=A0ABW8UQH2_9RHOB
MQTASCSKPLNLAHHWMLDQRRVFCAGFLSGVGTDERQELRVNGAAAFLAEMRDDEFATASDSLLGLLGDMHEDVYAPDPDDTHIKVSVERQHQLARKELDRRQGKAGGRERSVLLDHAAWLLQDDRLNLENVLKWLKWNSPSLTKEVVFLLRQLSGASADETTQLERWLLQARGSHYGQYQRLRAVDNIHGWVLTRLAEFTAGETGRRADERTLIAPWWTRLCNTWRNAHFFWPLFFCGPDDLLNEQNPEADLFYGMSLPVALTLSPNADSKVRFEPEPDRLELAAEWRAAFDIGLRAGKAMWRSQNSRLRLHAASSVADKERSDLIVDMSMAEEIVSVLGFTDEARYQIGGRSAEAYWAQACLSLLLDAGMAPAGVATGCIEEVQGALRVMPVGGLEQKLYYANGFGFSRVIVPGQERALIEAETAQEQNEVSETEAASPYADAIAAYLRFRSRIEERNMDLRVEVNFCPDARTSADALQSKGWRRASFFRLPETQREFGEHLRRLHLSDAEPRKLTAFERRAAKDDPWRPEETEALEVLDAFLLGDQPRAVRHISRNEFDLLLGKIAGGTKNASTGNAIPQNAEAAIGKWLAWQDHKTRRGPMTQAERRRSGLGVLALKSQVGDYEYRLWATIAEQLDATSDWFTNFRWADKERAAERLAGLLGNTHVDKRISRTAPPDLVIIFDEACFTGPRPTVVPFESDFSADWRPILDPRWRDTDTPFPLEEHLHASSDGLVGIRNSLWPEDDRRRTRILIIQGPSADLQDQKRQRNYVPKKFEDVLARLSIFRFGFSVHAAYAILNHGVEEVTNFTRVRRILSEMRARNFLQYSRGTYFINPHFRAASRTSTYQLEATYHMQAAFALCPLLRPSKRFVSENRDKSLNVENVQEAIWHLKQAVRLLPPKDRTYRQDAIAAQKSLSLIPRIPDWDTFNEMHRRGRALLADAYALGSELFSAEKHVAALDGHTFQTLGHRPGKMLDVIGAYGADLRKRLASNEFDPSEQDEVGRILSDLTRECQELFQEYACNPELPKRVARRTATQYEQAAVSLGTWVADEANEIIQRCLDEIGQASYLACSEEEFLDTYLIHPWWKWKIYSEDDRVHRRELCRLAARSELMKQVHTDWDQKFEEPWTIFFQDLPDRGCDLELSEMLALWWEARGSDLVRRAAYRDVVLGLRGQRGTIFENYLGVLQRGGTRLLGRVSRSQLSEEEEKQALAYLSAVNLSDPVLAFDLISKWNDAEINNSGLPLSFQDWVGSSQARGEFVGSVVANKGSWAAMFQSTPKSEHGPRKKAWYIAKRFYQPAKLPAVNPLLLNTKRGRN